MINFKQLKILFEIDEETKEAYRKLQSTLLNKDSKDLLYICENERDADKYYNTFSERNRVFIKNKDKTNRLIEFESRDKIHIWSIHRVTKQIDGYRFRDIRFLSKES